MKRWTGIGIAAALALVGCQGGGLTPWGSDADAEQVQPAGPLRDLPAIEDENGGGRSAVGQALVWSEKYSQLAEKMVQLEQEKQAVEKRRQEAQQRADGLAAELAQARKDLEEAQEFLRMQKEELAEWKRRVTGLQGENQRALLAIIEKQNEIIRLLGGEVPDEGAPATPVPPQGAAPAAPQVSVAQDESHAHTN